MFNSNAEKITLDKIKLFERARELGLPVAKCAKFAKVSEKTIYNWKNKGAEEKKICDENKIDYQKSKDHLYIYFLDIYETGMVNKQVEIESDFLELGKDRYFTDKDGVRRIDKAGSYQVNLMWLRKNAEEWKEATEQTTEVKTYVSFEPIKEENKADLLADLKAAQQKQIDSLKNQNFDNDNDDDDEYED